MEIDISHASGSLIFIEVKFICLKGAGIFFIMYIAFEECAPVFEMVFAPVTCDGSALVGMDHYGTFGGDCLRLAVIGQYVCRNIVGHGSSHSAERNCKRR